MAIWLVIKKAIQIKWAVSRLKRAKINAYRETKGLKRIYVWYETIFRAVLGLFQYICLRACCWCLLYRRKNQLSVWDSLWTSGTISNSIMISFGGLLCGLLMTHGTTLFLIFQLNVSPTSAAVWTWLVGILFSFALAFSQTARLFAFLTLPQFFTRKGRAALLGFAIVLAISGPGKNTARNMEILTESMICTQEMAKNATAGLVRLVKDPISAISKAMKSVVDFIMEAANTIKGGLMYLIQLIKSLVNVILFAYDWLKKIVEVCNDKVGTPFERCWKAFDEAIEDCEYQLGSLLSWMCRVVDLFQNICYVTKIVDLLCWLPSLVKDMIFKPIKELLKNFMDSVKTFFDVRIPWPTYKFEHSLIPTKKFKEIIHDMKSEVLGEVRWLLDYMDWMNLLVSLLAFGALYKAIIYRRRFLTMDRHDNFYITKGLVKLDLSRKKVGKEYIFPLPYRESILYVQPSSLAMIAEERKKLKNSLAMVSLAAVQILNYMLLDMGLFLFLELLRRHGGIRIDTRNLLGYNIKITGTGFMSDMYRGILKALSPIGGLLPVFDTTPCLPIPSVPDYIRYVVLVCLILFCYLATLSEPYLLRLRHIICGIYYPERIAKRDRWLYTHILKSRGTFLSYARSRLIASLGGDKTTYRVSLIDRLSHTIPGFRFVAAYFGVRKKECFLCGKKGDLDDAENFFQCPICETIYCMECFTEIGKQCPAHSNVFDSSGEFSEEEPSESSDDDDDRKRLISSSARGISSKPQSTVTLLSEKRSALPAGKNLSQEFIENDSSSSSDSEYDEKTSSIQIISSEPRKTPALPENRNILPTRENLSSGSFENDSSSSSDSKYDGETSSIQTISFELRKTPISREKRDIFSTRENLSSDSVENDSSLSSDSEYESTTSSTQRISSEPGKTPALPEKRNILPTRENLSPESSENDSSLSSDSEHESISSPIQRISSRPVNAALYEEQNNIPTRKNLNQESIENSSSLSSDLSEHESWRGVTEDDAESKVSLQSGTSWTMVASKQRNLTKLQEKSSTTDSSNSESYDDSKLILSHSVSESTTSSRAGVKPHIHSPSPRSHTKIKTRFDSNSSDEATSTSELKWESGVGSVVSSRHSRYSEPDSCDTKEKFQSDFLEEVDGLDEDGICHHHQSADEEVFSNYDEVLSEMESQFSQNISGEEVETSSTNSQDLIESDNDDTTLTTNEIQPRRCCGQSEVEKSESTELSENDEGIHWINRSSRQSFQRNVAPNVAAMIQDLDTFYLGMPYPPHTNTFKEEQLLKQRHMNS